MARITSKRVAELTGLSLRNVQAMTQRGLIPGAARFGERVWTYDEEKVAAWITEKEAEMAEVGARTTPRPPPAIQPPTIDLKAGCAYADAYLKLVKKGRQ